MVNIRVIYFLYIVIYELKIINRLMEKIILEKTIKSHIENNFNQYSKYLNTDIQVFIELRYSVEEVANCLMFGLDKAAITLTNNILARLLKLSLIYNLVGIKPVPIEKWNSAFDEANRKYGLLPLGKTIELCKKLNLILESEKVYLVDAVKKPIINGYLNADFGKMTDILTEEAEVKQKIIPPLQSIQVENFTKANASRYFEFVFELIGDIANRLIEEGK